MKDQLLDREICIIGVIHKDGWVNLNPILRIADSIHSRYPNQQIHLILDFYGALNSLPQTFSLPDWCSYCIFNRLKVQEKKEVGKRLKEAGFVIYMGKEVDLNLEYYYSDLPSEKIPNHWLIIQESAEEETVESDGKSMRPWNLFNTALNQKVSYEPWLETFLAEKERLDTGFCFLRNTRELTFCYILTQLAYFKKSSENMNLYLKWEHLDSFLKEKKSWQSFKDYGVGSILFCRKDETTGQAKLDLLKTQREGKEIRLIDSFPLSHAQSIQLVRQSTSPFLGCIGEEFFAAILHEKTKFPFCEISAYKAQIWWDYFKLSEEVLGQNHLYTKLLKLHSSFQEMGKKLLPLSEIEKWDAYARELAELMEMKTCQEGLIQLHNFILSNKKERNDLLSLVEEKIHLLSN